MSIKNLFKKGEKKAQKKNKKRKIRPKWALPIDRLLAGNEMKQFRIPVVVIFCFFLVVTFIWFLANHCSVFLNGYVAEDAYAPSNVFDAAYFYLIGNGGQNLFPENHIVGIVLTLIGMALVAILTSSITNYLDKRAQGYLSGETAYKLKDHYVILGASDVAYSIISQYAKDDKNYFFLIETGKDVEKTRREFYSFFEDNIDDDRIIFIYGERTSEDDIKRLRLPWAKEVFVIGDSDESDTIESYRDSYNMESLDVISKEMEKNWSGKRITCHVLFEYQTTFSAFQFTDLKGRINEYIDFRPFNFYDMWAQKVLIKEKVEDENHKFEYLPLYSLPDGGYIGPDSPQTVHLIIVGMAKMGISMAVQAAHLCHFPNFIKDKSKKTRITFIDANAAVEKDFFLGRFRDLMHMSRYRYVDVPAGWKDDDSGWVKPKADWLDIEWEFINGRVEQPEIQHFIEDAVNKEDHIVTLAICLPKSHQSIAAALYLPESVYEKCLQILVYQRLSGFIVGSIATQEENDKKENQLPQSNLRYRKLRPFGMIEYGFDKDLDDDTAARMVNHAHKPEKTEEEAWKAAKVSDRWSSQFNAHSIGLKLRMAGYLKGDDTDVIASKLEKVSDDFLKVVEHNRWNMEKLLTGFRTLNADEERDFIRLKEEYADLKERGKSQNLTKEIDGKIEEIETLKGKYKAQPNMAHLDIRSYEDVLEFDPGVAEKDNDGKLIGKIPEIVKKVPSLLPD